MRLRSNQMHRALCRKDIRVGKEQWKKKEEEEEEENRSEKSEKRERFLLVFSFSIHTKKKNYSTSIILWVIVMVTSMNRYYFNEVFKQISSKIDQLKTFLPPTTHLQVNIKEKQIYPFS